MKSWLFQDKAGPTWEAFASVALLVRGVIFL